MTKTLVFAVSAVLVGADQLIKSWVTAFLRPVAQIPVIPGFFYLTYVENRGAAFGILYGKTIFLIAVILLLLSGLIVTMLTGRIKSNFLLWSCGLVVAGGIGNLIDRVRLGYVVDYLDFSVLFGFPMFNFADCCVVIGVSMIFLHILFFERRLSPREDNGQGEGQN